MLNQSSIEYIGSVAKKFGARRVLLFGSCLYMNEGEAGDIDLAVEGLSEDDALEFAYSFYWVDDLGGKWVDVVRLEDDGDLNPIIFDEGVEIYAAEKSAHPVA